MYLNMIQLNSDDWEKYLNLRFQLGEYKEYISKYIFEIKYNAIKQQGGTIYVIKNKDKLIATGKLLVETKIFQSVGHIEDVVVDNEHRGRGYGKKVIQFLLNAAKEKNCYKVILNTRNELTNFYTKCGLINEGVYFSKHCNKLF